MKRIQYYCKRIWAYFDAVGYFLLRAYRYPFYYYYLNKLSVYLGYFVTRGEPSQWRSVTKQDFDDFRDKYGLSESIMGLLVHILTYERGHRSFRGREYKNWYSEDESLKLLLSGSTVWEQLSNFENKLSDSHEIESLKYFLLCEMLERKMYLKIPLK